jgi:thymidylate kinase
MAKLVVVEGHDKSGKFTQSIGLVVELRKHGYSAVRIEPAKETLPAFRKLIYWMLDTGWARRLPNTFQLVQFCNKVFFQLFRLPGWTRNYDFVVLDRWALSGYVYGSVEGVNPWLNEWMFNRLKRADITLILTGTSYQRPEAGDDSYEKDAVLQRNVKEEYWLVGASTEERWSDHVLVSNFGTPGEISQKIVMVLVHEGVLDQSIMWDMQDAAGQP